MIDIHSHVIPGVDDGAKNIEVSKEMLSIAAASGTDQIIATPHYCRGYYENNYSDILTSTKELNAYISSDERKIGIKVLPGQEVMIDDYTLDLYKEGIIGTLNGTSYMLVEFPMQEMPKDGLDILYELALLGIKPILAHPERYEYIINKPSYINSFLAEGLLFQINSGSITGVFGDKVQRTAEILIKHGICNFIASDAHTAARRKPGIKEALEAAEVFSSGIKNKVNNNSKAMIANGPISVDFEKIKERKNIFSFFIK